MKRITLVALREVIKAIVFLTICWWLISKGVVSDFEHLAPGLSMDSEGLPIISQIGTLVMLTVMSVITIAIAVLPTWATHRVLSIIMGIKKT